MVRVLQVVGYQNSGKTTFIVNFIKSLSNSGLKVGTIKHHGHPDVLKHDDLEKDTGKHRHAGASVSVIEGNGSILLSADKGSLTLQQLLSMYKPFELDVIVVEGFKKAEFPKIAIIRFDEDIHMMKELVNVVCILSTIKLPVEITAKNKTFSLTNECIDWLLLNKVGERID